MEEKEKQDLIEKVIKHWKEMVEWVEKQKPEEITLLLKMEKEIGQSWGSYYCDFCKKFLNFDTEEPCVNCPLFKKYGSCSKYNKDKNLWWNIDVSKVWSEWLINARLFLKQLESLRD